MSKRLYSLDTDADTIIRSCIEATPPQSFIVRAGAGSGKTTSLIKALHRVLHHHGALMSRRKQKVACITYTELAAHEIAVDVNANPLVHVSTIHSFYWEIIRPFQSDMKKWVKEKIEAKLDIAKSLEANGHKKGTRQTTKDKNKRAIIRLGEQVTRIERISLFTYGMGSNYAKGIFGHADILNFANFLLHERPLIRRVVALRFPFLFIDECQDAMEDMVESFRRIESDMQGSFCLGFFGDPMQKIYLTGVGVVRRDPRWQQIDKPENYRCAKQVLDVANAIREKCDGLKQIRGAMEDVNGVPQSIAGTARLFVLPRTLDRTKALEKVRAWVADSNKDELWRDEGPSAVKVLVIVHKIAANRLGFGTMYTALNRGASDSLKQGFQDGSAWPLRPFTSFVLPLVAAMKAGREFEAMRLLRAMTPKLQKHSLTKSNAAKLLREVRAAVLQLSSLMEEGGGTVQDVLRHLYVSGLVHLDERYVFRLIKLGIDGPTIPNGEAATQENANDVVDELEASGSSDDRQVEAFFTCAASEMWPYLNYVNEQSAFATQHGVKGDEFDRVMVVMDDSESDFNHYSYEKYFKISASNAAAGAVEESQAGGDAKEALLESEFEGMSDTEARTARLLYVCCTRAKRDLVLVLFTDDEAVGKIRVLESGILPSEQVYGAESICTVQTLAPSAKEPG